MMERLVNRARVAGARRAGVLRGEVARRIEEAVRGVEVSIEGDDVVVAGRGLRWRAVGEPALRWIGSLLK